MLDEFTYELDSTQSRMDNVMKKLAKVSHMTSGKFEEMSFPCRLNLIGVAWPKVEENDTGMFAFLESFFP